MKSQMITNVIKRLSQHTNVEICQHQYINTNDYEGQQNYAERGDFCMPEQWTADIIGEMHLNHITAKELSAQLGYHPKYVSKVLNGHCNPKKAEQTFRQALDELIQQKEKMNGGT